METLSTNAFISYSHRDKKHLEDLKRHMSYLEKKYQLHIWDDRMIPPGGRWRDTIETALVSAKVGILLVSTDFLASDFIMNEELPFLLQATQERNLQLLSIIVRPCLFEETPLSAFQLLNTTPLTLMSKAKCEDVLRQIAMKISRVLQEVS